MPAPSAVTACSARDSSTCQDRLWNVRDLDQTLAALQTRDRRRQLAAEDLAESGVRRIAASHPQYLRRRAEPPQHLYEVGVLGHHHRIRGAGSLENRRVFGVAQPQVADS